ncbi:putative aldolase [Lyophyllum shimeji]|uniref:fructose-bisphosphate aldolase n=1 Tax=Lyophyllum shimeji TaxID=47721 RepID=A0A9P3PNG4_LYOSH|nr:putative aldolase [Lyophyllum shimeji]
MPPITANSYPSNLFSTPDLASDRRNPPDVFLQPLHTSSVARELIDTARALVHPRGKGIYATDEDPQTIAAVLGGPIDEARLKEWTEEEQRDRRRKWREAAYKAISSEYISGVILYPETLIEFQLAELLTSKGIIPGVRANADLRPIPRSEAELAVEGLDGLLKKLQAARIAGARFSKWRCPIACTSVVRGLPTQAGLETQADTLAQYAAISQQAGLVPIVEPDVAFTEDADLPRSADVHERVISAIYERCRVHGVLLEGSLIKPSFPQPGLKHPSRDKVTAEDVGLAIATVIARSVPISVPGVVFLSGGLPSEVATSYLAALNALVNSSKPDSPFRRLPVLSFSFGRALQGDAAKHWVRGDEEKMKETLEKWSRACWLAAQGKTA